MQEKAIVYFIVAWLACWLVDLIVLVVRGPVFNIDPILKLIIVLVCLAIVLVGLSKHGWLLP